MLVLTSRPCYQAMLEEFFFEDKTPDKVEHVHTDLDEAEVVSILKDRMFFVPEHLLDPGVAFKCLGQWSWGNAALLLDIMLAALHGSIIAMSVLELGVFQYIIVDKLWYRRLSKSFCFVFLLFFWYSVILCCAVQSLFFFCLKFSDLFLSSPNHVRVPLASLARFPVGLQDAAVGTPAMARRKWAPVLDAGWLKVVGYM